MAKARQQYFADETSLQKDSREFAIADDVQQKIDSIEEGAQVNVIETVKVNGTALTPDANKAVDIDVPDVIDNLYTTSSDDALSANQGKLLYDYIQNLSSRGRFLSNWNTATGLPTTNPSENPYTYMAGDYYMVSNVASGGGTNYRPNGSSYTIGQASTTVETNIVDVSDIYLYDGTNWLLLTNSSRQIAVDSSLSTTSTNPVENRVITNELNKKYYGVVSNATPSNPTEGMLWYDTANDILKTYDGTNWNEAGTQMVVLSYGNSTWNDFITAYAKNAVVYCRASSNADPSTGTQGRMAFMAYVNNATSPTEVEFQYYRSVSSHSASQQGDQVFVYKLTNASGGTWTVTTREASSKIVAGTGLSSSYSSGTLTITNAGVTSVNSNTGAVTVNDVKVSATAPSSPTEGMVWYDTTNDQLKVYDGTNWNVTGKEYNAGPGIEIGTVQDYSAIQGPCSDGFHVPTDTEFSNIFDIMDSLGIGADTVRGFVNYLLMPRTDFRDTDGSKINRNTNIYCWTCNTNNSKAIALEAYDDNVSCAEMNRGCGFSIRPFKNEPVIPDNGWTVLYSGTGDAGVFHNSTDGLISLSSDGTNWITIADKNLGATTVYHYEDTMSESNCGKFYQRGNNYGFPFTGSVTTSSTQVDASNYGPGNYYNSDTFITVSTSPYDWSSVQNDNLWGGETGVVTLDNAITNTGVLSVNGQTGDVTIPTPEESNTKTFYLSGTGSSATVLAEAQAAYDWYVAGKNPIIMYNNVAYILSSASSSDIYFKSLNSTTTTSGSQVSSINQFMVAFSLNSGNVTEVTHTSSGMVTNILKTNVNYGTPYIPTYNGSPATKKYVDDSIGGLSQIKVHLVSCPFSIGDDWSAIWDDLDGGGYSVVLADGSNRTGLVTFWTTSPNIVTVVAGEETYEVTLDSDYEISAIDIVGGLRRFDIGISEATASTDVTDLVNYLDKGGNAYIHDSLATLDWYIGWYTNHSIYLFSCAYGYVYMLQFTFTQSGIHWYAGTPTSDNVYEFFNPSNAGSTGQVLTKTATGYNWANSGVNTKTFYITTTGSGDTAKAEAQAALDWYLAGNNPIIIYSNRAYILHSYSSSSIYFRSLYANYSDSSSYSYDYFNAIYFNISSGSVTSTSTSTAAFSGYYLRTGKDYTTPYTPTYNGSPATKKYVDDKVAEAISNDTTGTTTTVTKIWAGTEAEFANLQTKDSSTIYYTF